MKAVTHLEKVINGEVSAVTHLEQVIAEVTAPVTYLEKVIAGEATPITHLQKVIAGTASPVIHLEYIWAGAEPPTPTEHEYTGAVPTTITANGEPLIAYRISGNMQQTGTPTPESPITPSECGERTVNLYDKSVYLALQGYSDNSGEWRANSPSFCSIIMPCEPNTTYVVSKMVTNRQRLSTYSSYPQNGDMALQVEKDGDTSSFSDITTHTDAHWLAILLWYDNGDAGWRNRTAEIVDTVQVETGVSEPTAYEPYGYKIPVLSGGVTTNIYIGSEPLRKSLDGTVADTVESTGTLTRRVDSEGNPLAEPTTETITAPTIPTINGEQTFDVQTTLKPSEVYIKYTGR